MKSCVVDANFCTHQTKINVLCFCCRTSWTFLFYYYYFLLIFVSFFFCLVFFSFRIFTTEILDIIRLSRSPNYRESHLSSTVAFICKRRMRTKRIHICDDVRTPLKHTIKQQKYSLFSARIFFLWSSVAAFSRSHFLFSVEKERNIANFYSKRKISELDDFNRNLLRTQHSIWRIKRKEIILFASFTSSNYKYFACHKSARLAWCHRQLEIHWK